MSFTIGCHLSASKGFLDMAQTAASIGANTFQFFTRNPRGGQAKPVDPADVAAFQKFSKENGINVILAHAPYTLNFCAARPEIRAFARETLADDIKRMEMVPGNMYNFHPGSHVQQGPEIAIDFIAETLNAVLTPELTTTVLLETMAGKGSEVGSRFEELAAIIDKVELKEKMGVCLDTCHVSDAGYDIIGNPEGVLDEFDRVIGLNRLKAIHVNDSLNPMGAHKDRHACVGEGQIGLDAIVKFINNPRIEGLPMILETPQPDLAGYGKEIKMLREMSK